jgi:hypothetical protein
MPHEPNEVELIPAVWVSWLSGHYPDEPASEAAWPGLAAVARSWPEGLLLDLVRCTPVPHGATSAPPGAGWFIIFMWCGPTPEGGPEAFEKVVLATGGTLDYPPETLIRSVLSRQLRSMMQGIHVDGKFRETHSLDQLVDPSGRIVGHAER